MPKKAKKKTRKTHDPEVKVRKKLIANSQVTAFIDAKTNWAVIRVLHRKNAPPLPEFGLKVTNGKMEVKEAVEAAGFTDELDGKWVLRTNKFNIFVFV